MEPSLIARVDVWPGPPRPDVTLEKMKEIVLAEYQDPQLVETAADIVDEVSVPVPASITTGDMAAAILEWLRLHTRFVPDPVSQQLLKAPLYMLAMIRRDEDQIVAGDCVDLAMLGAALSMAVGMTPRFIAESYAHPCLGTRSPLVHVYTVVQTQKGWLHLDTQQPPDGIPVVPCRRETLALTQS